MCGGRSSRVGVGDHTFRRRRSRTRRSASLVTSPIAAERERDLGLEGQRQMTAGEDEAQAVVGDLVQAAPAFAWSPSFSARRSRRQMRSMAL